MTDNKKLRTLVIFLVLLTVVAFASDYLLNHGYMDGFIRKISEIHMPEIHMPERKDKEKKSGPVIAVTLEGTYSMDQYTSYYFDGNGKGFMHTDFDDYAFTYEKTGDTLKIDFEDEKAKDAEYSYTLTEDLLTLVRGTQTYEMKKQTDG